MFDWSDIVEKMFIAGVEKNIYKRGRGIGNIGQIMEGELNLLHTISIKLPNKTRF